MSEPPPPYHLARSDPHKIARMRTAEGRGAEWRGGGAGGEPDTGQLPTAVHLPATKHAGRSNRESREGRRGGASAVRRAGRVHLGSLLLGEGARTAGERNNEHREHRRERDRLRESYEAQDVSRNPLSPTVLAENLARSEQRARRSVPAPQRDALLSRDWALQKLAHWLERPVGGRTCGALVLGDSGCGKTMLCRELTEPGSGAQARRARALSRRLLAAHSVQSDTDGVVQCAELVRSLIGSLLKLSSRRERETSPDRQRHHYRREERGECSEPLLPDSEDQRTDEEEVPLIQDAPLSGLEELPEVMPRTTIPNTNPFLTNNENSDVKIYENHENVFLRNISQRQSKEIRNSRLLRQSSEPLTDKKINVLQKSNSVEPKAESTSSENERDSKKKDGESYSPTNAKISRIPVANFRYPNRSGIGTSSNESSPHKKTNPLKDTKVNKKLEEDDEIENKEINREEELPEYQNILKATDLISNFNITEPETPELETEIKDFDDVPPPIPSLPISPRTLVANAYYDKVISETEIHDVLENLDKNPDECFKRAFLYPLLELDPPKQCLFLLIDSLDDYGSTVIRKDDEGRPVSRTVTELLANHHHLLPQWLMLVCTARKQSKSLAKMFSGFRKIVLDDLTRTHVSADMQRYVLTRLDCEPRLRACVATAPAAAAAALDHLRIKSDGCLLYLEKVLDGIADGFIALREIREIPGTLNGLYLWLAQRIFHGRRFNKVRLMVEVLLAARAPVSELMLYKCLLASDCTLTRRDFNKRMHLLRRVAVHSEECGLRVFHHSFGAWLQDVKHCTRRYLCSPAAGHAALAMLYTLQASSLTTAEVYNCLYHTARIPVLEYSGAATAAGLDHNTIVLLWLLDSGCRLPDEKGKDLSEEDNLLQNGDADSADAGQEGERRVARALRPPAASDPLSARLLRRFASAAGSQRCPAPGATPHLHQANLIDLHTTGAEERAPAREEPPICGSTTRAHQLAEEGRRDELVALLERWPDAITWEDALGARPLHCAARHGRAACAAALLRAGARPDVADADGWSPLRAAAWAGHTEVVEVLLEQGCQVDCVDADNRTALRAAAWSGHESVVALLLAGGARADCPDAEGRTPLMAAAYMGHADIVRLLLDAGADVNWADKDGRTALGVAALCAQGAACCALLLERGADVSAADRERASALSVAAQEGHVETCELLLEGEADAESADAAGRTALWCAASAGHAPVVKLLLFWGACVDTMDAEGRTVLSVAAAQGNVEVVRQLLDRGLDENHRDNSGWTPLHYAAFEGHAEVCAALLEAGAKVDEADNDGKGPLMLAAQEGHTRLVEMLIDDWGAPVDQRAHDGKTAFRAAALEEHIACMEALHARGAQADATDADGRSALYVLALDNRLAAAACALARCGADPHVADTEGRTPLHVAAWQGHSDMVNLLIKIGKAEVDARDRCARTALHAAAWRGRSAALLALLRAGAEPAAQCAQGASPLGIAAQEGHEECVLRLLQHGADPDQPDHCGRTPSAVARRAGHAGVCRLMARAPPAATAETRASTAQLLAPRRDPGASEQKRRSVHGGNSGELGGQPEPVFPSQCDKADPAELTFAQRVTRCGRGHRRAERALALNFESEQTSGALEEDGPEKDRDGYSSPLYVSPQHTRASDSPPACARTAPAAAADSTEQHFARDTHMRIILGRAACPRDSAKAKRNGVATNPAMRLVANVRNGLDHAAANIRRTGVALSNSANPAVKTDAFQWRRETPL